jgi:hypothetical protein
MQAATFFSRIHGLNGAFAIRIAIGHLRTTRVHTGRAWKLLLRTYGRARALSAVSGNRFNHFNRFVQLCGTPRAFRLHRRGREIPNRRVRDDMDCTSRRDRNVEEVRFDCRADAGHRTRERARRLVVYAEHRHRLRRRHPSNDKLTYGASLGWMGAGIVGFEADWSYTPTFFENNTDNISFADCDNVRT